MLRSEGFAKSHIDSKNLEEFTGDLLGEHDLNMAMAFSLQSPGARQEPGDELNGTAA